MSPHRSALLIKQVAAVLVAACFAFSANAQDHPRIDAGAQVFKTELSGFAITVPVPFWTKPGSPALDQSRAKVIKIRPGVTSLVFNKKDETAVDWTELMGILAVRLQGFTAGQQFQSLAEPLGRRCMPDALNLSWIVPLPDSDREALVGLCGQYNLATRNAQPCAGGIIVAVALETPEGAVSVYGEWCTGAFDATDEKAWPVPQAEIDRRARLLQTLTEVENIAAPESN